MSPAIATVTFFKGPSAAAADYLRDRGVSPRMIARAKASYSNTRGVGDALDALPVRAIVRLEALWDAADGEGDYRIAPRQPAGHAPDSLGSCCARRTTAAAARRRARR